jgi:hypothetical protein
MHVAQHAHCERVAHESRPPSGTRSAGVVLLSRVPEGALERGWPQEAVQLRLCRQALSLLLWERRAHSRPQRVRPPAPTQRRAQLRARRALLQQLLQRVCLKAVRASSAWKATHRPSSLGAPAVGTRGWRTWSAGQRMLLTEWQAATQPKGGGCAGHAGRLSPGSCCWGWQRRGGPRCSACPKKIRLGLGMHVRCEESGRCTRHTRQTL